MPQTTIKVSTEVRDRLKGQAMAAHRTMGEHLEHLADLDDRRARFAALGEAIAAMAPELIDSYHAETEAWERLDGD